MSKEAITTDLVSRLRNYGNAVAGTLGDAKPFSMALEAAAEIERLREVVTFPIITPEASSSALFIRVLSEHEKGQPVNAQDLINALMWRVRNQRREISRLQNPSKKPVRGHLGSTPWGEIDDSP